LLKFERGPAKLPADLLVRLVKRKPLLLCLDYDGTLSEIAREPNLAKPASGAVAVLRALANYRTRVAVAIVTGRTIEDLRKLVPLQRGVAIAGVHGLEILDAGGRREIVHAVRKCEADVQRARAWLEHNLPGTGGFVV
jgi:trehalose 6-phosphate phosphatase